MEFLSNKKNEENFCLNHTLIIISKAISESVEEIKENCRFWK